MLEQFSVSREELTVLVVTWSLTYLLHSTLLLGTAWLAQWARALRSNRIREWVWKTALVGGIVTASVQVGTGVEPFFGKIDVAQWLPGNDVPEPEPVASPAGILLALQPLENVEFAAVDSHPSVVPETVSSTEFDVAPAVPAASRWSLSRALLMLWSLGAVMFGLRSGAARLALWRRLRRRTPVEQTAILGILQDLVARSGIWRHVRLSWCSELSAPIAFGTLRPEICLPRRALEELRLSELRTVLAHELAHVLRHDSLWLRFTHGLESVLFFQPLHRVGRRHLLEAIEQECDAWAVRQGGGRVELAECLARVATWVLNDRAAPPVPCMAAKGSPLGRRIERLLDFRKSLVERPRRGIGLVLCATLFGAPWLAPGISATPQAEAGRTGADPQLDQDLNMFQTEDPSSGTVVERSSATAYPDRLGLRLELGALISEIDDLSVEAWMLDATDELAYLEAIRARVLRIEAKRRALEELLSRTPLDAPGPALTTKHSKTKSLHEPQ